MFTRTRSAVAASLAALALGACSDGTNSGANTSDLSLLNAAFNSTPAAFTNVESSFQGGAADGFFGPLADSVGRRGGEFGHGGGHRGPGGPGSRGHGHDDLLGGLGLGSLGFGPGPGFGGLMGGGVLHGLGGFKGGGRLGAADLTGCTLAASGRVTCPDTTRNGLTISRSFAFTTASGQAQAARDSLTTNTINAQVTVSGTTTGRHNATSTVSHTSTSTITGLAAGSTQRTLNATAQGTEKTVFATDSGTVTVEHAANNAIVGVVVPVGTDAYPTAGKVTRSMTVKITREGQASETSTRTEVITYDGSATAAAVITVDGTTKTCSLPLPRGRPTCQ
ncbi:MAG: hypothetical protein WKG32_10540 [Gemmatimonadaceae bacterium]